jgi:flagellar biosynthesis component FlhA
MSTTMSTLSSTVSECESHANLVKQLTKAYYQDDQQVKFLDLQAEVESLLQQLQNLKSEKVEISEDMEIGL